MLVDCWLFLAFTCNDQGKLTPRLAEMCYRLAQCSPEYFLVELGQLPADGYSPISQSTNSIFQCAQEPMGGFKSNDGSRFSRC